METVDGVELLLDVGLDRRVLGSSEVEISSGNGRWSRRHVLLLRHSPSPTEIKRALAVSRRDVDGLLFVVARAGRALNEAAKADRRVAYAALDDAVVCFQGDLFPAGEERTAAPSRPRRGSWVRLAILRVFALSPVHPLSQSEMARLLGVSHVAVRKQLPHLDELVEHLAPGWQATNRGACWDRFMSEYPGPQGQATFWAAADAVAAQGDRIQRAMSRSGGVASAVSGDFAADFYAPWRRPGHIVAYATDQPALEEHGFATVRPADATVEVRTPRDPTILAMSREWISPREMSPRRYVDPLMTAWDLCRSPGGDVESAVEQLRARALRETPLWA
jgi:hypothetical protein